MVKRGVWQTGGLPMEFPTIGEHDGFDREAIGMMLPGGAAIPAPESRQWQSFN